MYNEVMRYFIASRWANMKAVQILTENLMAAGHTVFSFVDDPRNFVSAYDLRNKPIFLRNPEGWQKNADLRRLHERNLEGIQTSDVVILLLPSGESSHIQAGIGYALGKKMILIGPVSDPEPHYLIFDEWYPTLETFISRLKK